MPELVFLQDVAVRIDVAVFRRPERERADRIREAAAGHGHALGFELGGGGVVGGEEHFERRAVLDLCVELAGRPERSDDLVARVLLEVRRDHLHRRREVGGHRDLHLVCLGGAEGECGDQACEEAGKT